MSDIAIKFEEVSKQYRLGVIGTGTISHDLNRWWHMIRGKEDPYLKIGQVNDRTSKIKSGYVWALRDISFEIKQGDIVGIIGKNGAGKSTLLKLLSRVTTPTTGMIKAKGRIGSLLEVGTGFHPELTGRENVYMNGAIMGMTRAEITRKLDEIIDFAGVEKYIDTPTKRYSSGMTVRLGFAVAAHLEPEILVVDEVLAVGDAEFQKRAIGKLQDVSVGQGRTVLFVSHNMTAVKGLCKTGIWIDNGTINMTGEINDIVSSYLKDSTKFIPSQSNLADRTDYTGNGLLRINSAVIQNEDSIPGTILNTEKTILNIQIANNNKVKGDIEIAGKITNKENVYIHYFSSKLRSKIYKINGEENYPVSVIFNNLPLLPGDYYINLEVKLNGEIVYLLENAISFDIVDNNFYNSGTIWNRGIVFLNQEWI